MSGFSMDGYNETTYGDRSAPIYDSRFAPSAVETDQAVSVLTQLANGGRLLDLGTGTGRLAIPLAQAGVDVVGVDISDAILARLREKADSDKVNIIRGDIRDISIDGTFDVVLLGFSTLAGLPTRDDQQKILYNARKHLRPDGYLVLDLFVPDVHDIARGNCLSLYRVDSDRVVLGAATYEPIAQTFASQIVVLQETGIKMYPASGRYIWPSELDYMAAAAKFDLEARWADWKKAPFAAQCQMHISIYRAK